MSKYITQTEIVSRTGISQPMVSKYLSALQPVGRMDNGKTLVYDLDEAKRTMLDNLTGAFKRRMEKADELRKSIEGVKML